MSDTFAHPTPEPRHGPQEQKCQTPPGQGSRVSDTFAHPTPEPRHGPQEQQVSDTADAREAGCLTLLLIPHRSHGTAHKSKSVRHRRRQGSRVSDTFAHPTPEPRHGPQEQKCQTPPGQGSGVSDTFAHPTPEPRHGPQEQQVSDTVDAREAGCLTLLLVPHRSHGTAHKSNKCQTPSTPGEQGV